jgi:GT2 family glycosyltransferase
MKDQLADYSYEHILIDNASTDGTVREIKIEAESDKRVKLMINNRNIGPQEVFIGTDSFIW